MVSPGEEKLDPRIVGIFCDTRTVMRDEKPGIIVENHLLVFHHVLNPLVKSRQVDSAESSDEKPSAKIKRKINRLPLATGEDLKHADGQLDLIIGQLQPSIVGGRVVFVRSAAAEADLLVIFLDRRLPQNGEAERNQPAVIADCVVELYVLRLNDGPSRASVSIGLIGGIM